ncbi:MgtC/SapB family protein [Clostridium polynesiense]|uniref:MgtC/SapB family protein n=1 Tax=Clostridium polynesiense TaxID=1325933 RepID=UPI00058E5063|nr:MgtC/SapB family protein [Clostridium polynesiense]
MQSYEAILRIMLAVLIGGAIGYEREFNNRPAGLRTHILVCLGAAVISLIQVQSIEETTNMILKYPQLESALKADIGRFGAQVVSGIGFLGAGTIIHEKGSIKGLTTAASLWVVGCIGLAIGMGYYMLSLTAGIAAVIILVTLKKFEDRFVDKHRVIKYEILYINRNSTMQFLEEYFTGKRIKVTHIEYPLEEEELIEEEQQVKKCVYTVLIPRYISSTDVLYGLTKNDSIVKATIL